jgi:drug/metabolite transporter (DMT)-like permease
VVTVLVSIVVFGDVFGRENFAGLFCVLSGIVAYNFHKVSSARQGLAYIACHVIQRICKPRIATSQHSS